MFDIYTAINSKIFPFGRNDNTSEFSWSRQLKKYEYYKGAQSRLSH